MYTTTNYHINISLIETIMLATFIQSMTQSDHFLFIYYLFIIIFLQHMLRVIFPQFVQSNLLSTYIIHLYQYYHIYEYQPDTLNNDQYFYTKYDTK